VEKSRKFIAEVKSKRNEAKLEESHDNYGRR
jgi:hypothetical protein